MPHFCATTFTASGKLTFSIFLHELEDIARNPQPKQ